MEIRNHSKLTKDLQVNFSKTLFMKSFKKSLLIVELLSAFVIALVLAFYIDKYWIAILLGVIMIAYPFVTYFLFYRTLKKTANDKVEGFEEIDCHFFIEETKIKAVLTFEGASNELVNEYNDFVQILETKDLFVLVLPNQQGYFIEKSGFENQEDINRVQELFKGLLGYKKI